MKTLPTQKRAIAKRDALIDSARHCFAELGYEQSTAKAIAKQAQVATGTFYQYFENKDDILRVLGQLKRDELLHKLPLGHPLALVNSTTPVSNQEVFWQVLELVYDYHQSEVALHQVLEQRRSIDNELDQILLQSEHAMEARVCQYLQNIGQQHGKSEVLTNAKTLAYNLFAMVEGLVHRHVFSAEGAHNERSPTKQQCLDLGAKMLACYFDCEHQNN